MESNPLNNTYTIYYLFHKYLTNTQFNVYWIIIARVTFTKISNYYRIVSIWKSM